MSTPSKTLTEIQAIEVISADGVAVTDEVDTSTMFQGMVYVDYAPDSATAKTGTGTRFTIEFAITISGPAYYWRPHISYTTALGTGGFKTSAIDGTETAPQTVIGETNVDPVIGDRIFIKDNTLANSEWGEVVDISAGVSYTLRDGTKNDHDSSDSWTNGAEHWQQLVNLAGVERMRVTAHNNLGTNNEACVWWVHFLSLDDIT